MPFTLAHPAAVVFFRKNKFFNFQALVLGAMAPDFIYFILFKPSSNIGHTFLGFLLLNLPICFLLNFLFNNFIKEPMILNLPKSLVKDYGYLIKDKNQIKGLKGFFIFSYSALIGMITHVLWDGFTHSSGYFVETIGFLTKSLTIGNHNLYIYKILQHGSTIIGTIILLIYLYKIKHSNNIIIESKISKLTYYLIIGITVIITFLLSYIFFKYKHGEFVIGSFVVTLVNGIFLGYLTAGVYYKFLKYKL